MQTCKIHRCVKIHSYVHLHILTFLLFGEHRSERGAIIGHFRLANPRHSPYDYWIPTNY